MCLYIFQSTACVWNFVGRALIQLMDVDITLSPSYPFYYHEQPIHQYNCTQDEFAPPTSRCHYMHMDIWWSTVLQSQFYFAHSEVSRSAEKHLIEDITSHIIVALLAFISLSNALP